MSNLTDLEICKRIAEIEFKDLIKCYEHQFDGICIDKPMCGMVFREAYNPLINDALCFQLMVKYKVCLRADMGSVPWVCTINTIQGYLSRNASPNKAICLAIIESHKEK